MSEQLQEQPSMFFDRHETYFGDYVAALGLPQNARDEDIVVAMEYDYKTRGAGDDRPLSLVVADGDVTPYITSTNWAE